MEKRTEGADITRELYVYLGFGLRRWRELGKAAGRMWSRTCRYESEPYIKSTVVWIARCISRVHMYANSSRPSTLVCGFCEAQDNRRTGALALRSKAGSLSGLIFRFPLFPAAPAERSIIQRQPRTPGGTRRYTGTSACLCINLPIL
jgi:hypothetical protein